MKEIQEVVSRQDLYDALHENRPDFDGKKIFIWGIGNTALLYQEGLKRLEKKNFFIFGYSDNNMEKLNGEKEFCGKPVATIDELLEEKDVYMLICTPQPKAVEAIGRQLNELRIPNIHIDEAIFKLHADELMECYDALDDTDSRNIYSQLVLCRMKGHYPKNLKVDKNQYFTIDRFCNHNEKEVFIDCGAFVGDTVERYIWNKGGVFGKVIALEPDKDSYKALACRIERLKKEWNLKENSIETILAGVGENNRGGVFVRDETNRGLGSMFVENASEGEVSNIYSIDKRIEEKFDFLKADIESYEYQMLMGAKESIKKNKPLLAICIYHNAVDFYSILLLIKTIEPDYKFAIRHHTNVLSDTVLYAWVEE